MGLHLPTRMPVGESPSSAADGGVVGGDDGKIPPGPVPIPDPLFRRTPITHKEIDKYGPTPGCVGCQSKMRGEVTRRGHSDRCRQRIEEAMRQDAQDKRKFEKADERMAHKIAKEVEKADRKRKAGEEHEEEKAYMDTGDQGSHDDAEGDRQKRRKADEPASSSAAHGGAAGGDE